LILRAVIAVIAGQSRLDPQGLIRGVVVSDTGGLRWLAQWLKSINSGGRP